jgi:hypothetical protein
VSYEDGTQDDELLAVQRELAALGRQPLPPAVATRLEARLAAERDASPLARRRARPPVRIGAAAAAAALVAAALVIFALSTGGGGPHRPPVESAALRATAAPAADSSAKRAAGAALAHPALAPKRACSPASRKAGDRPAAACPGARGGHARAV